MNNAALDQMAQTYEGCTIAAFADLDVGIPLRTAEGIRVGQEALNTLCLRANKIFAAHTAPSLLAVETSGSVAHVFVRAPDDPASAFIAEIDDTVPLDDFIAAAKVCVGADA
jgi:hypothetical protein